MQRLKYVRFGIPIGREAEVRSLLAEWGEKPPISFKNEDNDLVATTYSICLAESKVPTFIETLNATEIDGNPFVRSERQYSKSELEQAQLFWIHFLKQKDDGYTTYGTEFDASRACSLCTAGAVQASHLVLDCRKFAGCHVGATYNFEIIVSAQFANAIAGFSGFDVLPIIHYQNGKHSDAHFQLRPATRLPKLVPPTRFTESSKFCKKCGQTGLFLDSEMHIEGPPTKHVDAYSTQELFGELRDRTAPGPEVVFSQQLVNTIKLFDKRAVAVEPVFLEDAVYAIASL